MLVVIFWFLLSSDKFYIQYINHVSQDLENLRNSIIQHIQVSEVHNSVLYHFYERINKIFSMRSPIMTCS